MIDALGYVFYSLVLAGTLLVSSKHKTGWLLRAVGELGWVGLGFALGLTSIITYDFLTACIAIRAYCKWKDEDAHKNTEREREREETTEFRKGFDIGPLSVAWRRRHRVEKHGKQRSRCSNVTSSSEDITCESGVQEDKEDPKQSGT